MLPRGLHQGLVSWTRYFAVGVFFALSSIDCALSQEDQKKRFPDWAVAGVRHAFEESPSAAFVLLVELDDEFDVWTALAPFTSELSPAIAQRLEHSDWDVRRAAVQTLIRLDAHGIIPVFHALNHTTKAPYWERESSRATARLFGGGSAMLQTVVTWTGEAPGEVQVRRIDRIGGDLDDAEVELDHLLSGWQSLAQLPELLDELGINVGRIVNDVCQASSVGTSETLSRLPLVDKTNVNLPVSLPLFMQQVRSFLSSTCWPARHRATLVQWEEELRRSGNTNSANTIEKHINGIDRLDWAGQGLKVWGLQVALWVGLVALYPWSWAKPIRAFFFWNKWPRRFFGLFYVGLLLAYVPFLRRLLFLPFRRSLVADADLEHFKERYYFGGSEVRDEHGLVHPLQEAIPTIKGQIILEGASGTGKSMYLKLLAKRSRRIVVFLPASRCDTGVMEAITAKLPGLPADDSFLQQLISSGAFDVIIDGLNEVSAETRGQISNFAQRHFEGNIMLSSQPMEWLKPSLAKCFTLLPLDRPLIEDYLVSREAELPEASQIRGEEFNRRARAFLARVFDRFEASEEREAFQTRLANPMDLTLVAQILGQGHQPDHMELQHQAYELMAEDYRSSNMGADFPLQPFAEHCFELRLADSKAPSIEDWPNEVAAMERHKLLVRRVGGDIHGDIVFRHDKIMEYFIYPAFLGDAREERWKAHLDDPRFRGVFLLLAERLPLEQARALRDRLVDQAADTGDHFLSDEVVKLLRSRQDEAALAS